MPQTYQNHTIDFKDRAELVLGASTYTVKFENTLFKFFANFRGSKRTVVMFPGATNRSKGSVDFQRHSWWPDVDANLFCFSDPTIDESNELSIGWFQGKEDVYAIPQLAALLDVLFRSNSISLSEVTLFGSSAGGFVSLMLTNTFPHSAIVAINPQLYLPNYIKSFFYAMVETCYPNRTPQYVIQQHHDRLLVPVPNKTRTAPIVIFQNVCDERHFSRHLNFYLSTLPPEIYRVGDIESFEYSTQSLLNVFLYQDGLLRHNPPPKDVSLRYLSMAADLKLVNVD